MEAEYLLTTRYVTLDRGILRSNFTEDVFANFATAKEAMQKADLKHIAKKRKLREGELLMEVRLEVSKRSARGEKRIAQRSLELRPLRYF
jgi:hypothetical protein